MEPKEKLPENEEYDDDFDLEEEEEFEIVD